MTTRQRLNDQAAGAAAAAAGGINYRRGGGGVCMRRLYSMWPSAAVRAGCTAAVYAAPDCPSDRCVLSASPATDIDKPSEVRARPDRKLVYIVYVWTCSFWKIASLNRLQQPSICSSGLPLTSSLVCYKFVAAQ